MSTRGMFLAHAARALAQGEGNLAKALKLAREQSGPGRDGAVRALAAGVGSAGGFLVPQEQGQEIIELLRNHAVVRKRGARILPMPRDNLTVSRISSTANAGYAGEAVATQASQGSVSQVKFTGKKLIALAPLSNDLLKYSSPAADEIIRDDIIAAMAAVEDAAFIRGTGTQYSPRGMRYWAASGNVLTSAGTGLANIVTDLQAMVSALEAANVRMLKPGWILPPRTKDSIRFVQATTGQLVFGGEMNEHGTLLGYGFSDTNNVPANLGAEANQSEYYLADFADVAIGEVPEIEVGLAGKATYIDPAGNVQAGFSQDVSVLRVIVHHDFALRHDVSVAVMTAVNY